MEKQDWESWLFLGLLVLLAYAGGSVLSSSGPGTDGGVVDSVIQGIVSKLANAIASAEGWFVAGSRPQRDNNPGDLTLDVNHTAVGTDGPYMVYASAADGLAALESMIAGWFNGTSHIYDPTMTIAEVASHYTATQQDAWAANVAGYLGVTVDTPLNQIS